MAEAAWVLSLAVLPAVEDFEMGPSKPEAERGTQSRSGELTKPSTHLDSSQLAPRY